MPLFIKCRTLHYCSIPADNTLEVVLFSATTNKGGGGGGRVVQRCHLLAYKIVRAVIEQLVHIVHKKSNTSRSSLIVGETMQRQLPQSENLLLVKPHLVPLPAVPKHSNTQTFTRLFHKRLTVRPKAFRLLCLRHKVHKSLVSAACLSQGPKFKERKGKAHKRQFRQLFPIYNLSR